SRMNFVRQEEKGLEKLHSVVIEAINKLVFEVSSQAGVRKEDIYTITIVGNTTMHHLFAGISPKYLSQSPYISVMNEPMAIDPNELGIDINEAGKILILPNIAGFLGADTVGVLLAAEMDKSK